MHIPVLRTRSCQYLPRQLRHCFQHRLLVRSPYLDFDHHKQGLTVSHRVCSFIIIFIEIPLLLRICPTSAKFDTFIRKFSSNYMRAAIYLVMSAIQWVSIVAMATSLIVAAVFLLIAAIFYALAGFKGQEFQGSKTLGGQGVAQMII